MADAIRRLLEDQRLSERLVANGLAVVARDFDWERRTDEFEAVLDGVVAGPSAAAPPTRPPAPAEPELSIVVPVWNNLLYTQQFVDSVRRHTDVPYELIIVDNGSEWSAANYARMAADHVVLNATNLGFARGMNQGLAMARGRFVAFCNNDTVVPGGWASQLVETARLHPDAAIVVPAVTSARNEVNVRSEPGDKIEVLSPFGAPPAAIVYVMPTDVVRALGSWSEEYEIASGEDIDLCFTAWVNDFDIVYDQRVLVDHVGKGTSVLLDDWQSLWARNRKRFLAKWTGEGEVACLDRVDPARFARNRETARSVAGWMERYFSVRDREDRRNRRFFAKHGPVRRNVFGAAHAMWRKVRPRLPARLANRLGAAARRVE
jgi:GT2 family glycosyltransferase